MGQIPNPAWEMGISHLLDKMSGSKVSMWSNWSQWIYNQTFPGNAGRKENILFGVFRIARIWGLTLRQASCPCREPENEVSTQGRGKTDAWCVVNLCISQIWSPNDPWTFQWYEIKSSLLLKPAWVCFNITRAQKSPESYNPHWFWEVWTSGVFEAYAGGLINCGEVIAQC